MAYKDSINLSLNYGLGISEKETFLIAVNSSGMHFSFASYTSIFEMKLPRDKYFFSFYCANKISNKDSLDLRDMSYKPSFNYYFKFTSQPYVLVPEESSIKYIDNDYGVWQIHIDYDNKFSIVSDSLILIPKIVNYTIGWNGYCCEFSSKRKTDSISSEIEKIISNIHDIEKKIVNSNMDTVININGHRYDMFYQEGSLVWLKTNLRYVDITDCQNSFSVFESHLNSAFENEKLNYEADFERGIGRRYEIDKKHLWLYYGVHCKNQLPSGISNTTINIPTADHYFITIEYTK